MKEYIGPNSVLSILEALNEACELALRATMVEATRICCLDYVEMERMVILKIARADCTSPETLKALQDLVNDCEPSQ